MQKISSKDNEFIKSIRKLKDKKYRDLTNSYIIEGIKIIEEAIKEKIIIKQIIICEDCEKTGQISKELMYEIAKYECIYVTKNVFDSITGVNNPQGILAIIEKNNKEIENIDYAKDFIVMLDDIQDPGNLGTIIRTADSANISQILISKDTADVYNLKVVRSTMGAIFRVNIIECNNLKNAIIDLKKNNFKSIVTSLDTNNSIYDIDFKNEKDKGNKQNKNILIIGNEANGVRKEILEIADIKVKIPMIGKTESLNASVATGIIIYEYVRQNLKQK